MWKGWIPLFIVLIGIFSLVYYFNLEEPLPKRSELFSKEGILIQDDQWYLVDTNGQPIEILFLKDIVASSSYEIT